MKGVRLSTGLSVVFAAILFTPLPSPAPADDGDGKASERMLRKEIVVPATLEDVWQGWTTEEGTSRFFGQQSKIELRPGGAYEIYFNAGLPYGQRGTEGCHVLTYMPMEMLAFEWSAPPSIPNLRQSEAKTQVVVRFDKVKDGVRIRLTQLGFGDGEDWDAYYSYFDRAWPSVLEHCKDYFSKAKKQSRARSKIPDRTTTTEGRVTVTATAGPNKRQDFEISIPVPVERVWNILATTDGLKKLGGSEPSVELKPGGKYAFWPKANNRVMAFIPHEMLATTGSAPPKFPNVQKGSTWGAYFFEPDDGGTRLKLSVIGWKDEPEWNEAFDYFLKNNPIWLHRVYDRLMEDAKSSSDAGSAMPVRDRVYRTAGDGARPDSHVGILAPLIGTWESTSTESDGGKFHARVVYEWGLGGKLVKSQS